MKIYDEKNEMKRNGNVKRGAFIGGKKKREKMECIVFEKRRETKKKKNSAHFPLFSPLL